MPATPAAIARSLRYQNRQADLGLCPKCSTPAARACTDKECVRYRKLTELTVCLRCGAGTQPMKLCIKHLEMDRERKAVVR